MMYQNKVNEVRNESCHQKFQIFNRREGYWTGYEPTECKHTNGKQIKAFESETIENVFVIFG